MCYLVGLVILYKYFQLQLQRNEVIALGNLLNRLSESVKFVHEMGVMAEKAETEEKSVYTNKIDSWLSYWKSMVTK